MADFLTRLAARTLGVVPVAQPVIAPMFAKGHTVPGSAIESEEMNIPSAQGIPSAPSRPTPMPKPPVTQTQHQQPLVTIRQPPRRSNHAQIAPPNHTKPESPKQTEAEPLQMKQNSIAPIAAEKPSRKRPIGKNTREENAIQENTSREQIEAKTNAPAKDVSSSIRNGAQTSILSEEQLVEYHLHNAGSARQTKEIATPTSIVVTREARPVLSAVEESIAREQRDKVDLAAPHEEPVRIASVQDEEVFVAPRRSAIVPAEISIRADSTQQRSTQSMEQALLVPESRQTPGVTNRRQTESVPIEVYSASPARTQAQTALSPEPENKLLSNQRPLETITEAAASTPTIHVTIGRVDVRAVTPPASTSSPRQTGHGPTLSLEDYTRQRRGGKR